jgi:hypothetical protein
LLSLPKSGTPLLTGALELGLLGATVSSTNSETSWFIELSFDRLVSLQINNAETLSWYERTHLVTDGSPWTGGFSTKAVPGEPGNPANGIVDGVGTQSLTLYSTPASVTNGYPYGLFASQSLRTLDIGYGVIVPNGADGNVVQVRVVTSIPIPTVFTEIRPVGVGNLRLSLSGPTAKLLTVEASTNLTDWLPIATVPQSSGSDQVFDPDAGAFPRRFYRAVVGP